MNWDGFREKEEKKDEKREKEKKERKRKSQDFVIFVDENENEWLVFCNVFVGVFLCAVLILVDIVGSGILLQRRTKELISLSSKYIYAGAELGSSSHSAGEKLNGKHCWFLPLFHLKNDFRLMDRIMFVRA